LQKVTPGDWGERRGWRPQGHRPMARDIRLGWWLLLPVSWRLQFAGSRSPRLRLKGWRRGKLLLSLGRGTVAPIGGSRGAGEVAWAEEVGCRRRAWCTLQWRQPRSLGGRPGRLRRERKSLPSLWSQIQLGHVCLPACGQTSSVRAPHDCLVGCSSVSQAQCVQLKSDWLLAFS
jgi:hypothetical protein